MRDAPEWIMVGRVKRPHGKAGELLVEELTDFTGRFETGVGLHAESPGGGGKRSIRVAASRRADKGMIIRFEGVDSRDAAKVFAGSGLFVSGDSLQPAAAGSYYPFELEGCRVFQGDDLVGRVRALQEARANPYLEVMKDDGTSVLIPFVKDVVRSVDTAAERIDIIEGFLR